MSRIGFSHPKNPGILTRFAMWLDKADFSHVFILYWDADWHCDMVIQIDEFGFRLVTAEKFSKQNTIKYSVDVSKQNFGNFEEGLSRVAREFVGEMYDFRGFLGMLPVLLWRQLKRRIKNPLSSKTTVFCSEGATLALQYGECPGASELDPGSTSPKDLFLFLSQKG